MKPNPNPEGSPQPNLPLDWIELVRRHVANLRFGVLQITVHAGRVVQMERTERFRLDTQPSAGAADTP